VSGDECLRPQPWWQVPTLAERLTAEVLDDGRGVVGRSEVGAGARL